MMIDSKIYRSILQLASNVNYPKKTWLLRIEITEKYCNLIVGKNV